MSQSAFLGHQSFGTHRAVGNRGGENEVIGIAKERGNHCNKVLPEIILMYVINKILMFAITWYIL